MPTRPLLLACALSILVPTPAMAAAPPHADTLIVVEVSITHGGKKDVLAVAVSPGSCRGVSARRPVGGGTQETQLMAKVCLRGQPTTGWMGWVELDLMVAGPQAMIVRMEGDLSLARTPSLVAETPLGKDTIAVHARVR
jgi:hypothetical protein